VRVLCEHLLGSLLVVLRSLHPPLRFSKPAPFCVQLVDVLLLLGLAMVAFLLDPFGLKPKERCIQRVEFSKPPLLPDMSVSRDASISRLEHSNNPITALHIQSIHSGRLRPVVLALVPPFSPLSPTHHLLHHFACSCDLLLQRHHLLLQERGGMSVNELARQGSLMTRVGRASAPAVCGARPLIFSYILSRDRLANAIE